MLLHRGRAAAKIKSRHVLQVYDNGVLEDQDSVRHGAAPRQTLFSRVHVRGLVPLPEAVMIIEYLCRRGLASARSASSTAMVKLENIFRFTGRRRQLHRQGPRLRHREDRNPRGWRTVEHAHRLVARQHAHVHEPQQARGLRTIDHRTSTSTSYWPRDPHDVHGNISQWARTPASCCCRFHRSPAPARLAGGAVAAASHGAVVPGAARTRPAVPQRAGVRRLDAHRRGISRPGSNRRLARAFAAHVAQPISPASMPMGVPRPSTRTPPRRSRTRRYRHAGRPGGHALDQQRPGLRRDGRSSSQGAAAR